MSTPRDDSLHDPDRTSHAEAPPPLIEDVKDVLTPMGEIESMGSFARGLGVRRMKIVIALFGGIMLLIALAAALD